MCVFSGTYANALQVLSKLHASCIYSRLANTSLPTLPSCSPDKTYVFIAMYRMVGAVLSAPCALVDSTAGRGARPSPLTMFLDAVGTTNAAALLHRSAATVHTLLAMVAHVLLLPFLSGCYPVCSLAPAALILEREFHPRRRAHLRFRFRSQTRSFSIPATAAGSR